MIETLEEYEHAKRVADSVSGPTAGKLVELVETLLPFLILAREELIVSVGSHVTMCTLCDTSWLSNKDAEHHEETCIFHGTPKWAEER